MDTGGSSIYANHSGLVYYFCTEQCQENFLVRPGLYIGNKAAKLRGREIIKRRTFMLEQVVTGLQRDAVMMALNQLMSVRNITVAGNKIAIDYNLLEVNAGQIEMALVKAGVLLGEGWGERLKRGWIHYTEETELDNLAAGDAACCNKPPAKG